MTLSQKCQYAIRAIFELGKRYGEGPVRISEIAEAQAIPNRFLELIMRQLRQAEFVESRRGVRGGYLLARPPSEISVGQVIALIDGDQKPVQCLGNDSSAKACPLHGNCVFMGLWSRARDAVNKIYDGTSFQDLIDEDAAISQSTITNFCI